MPRKSLGCARQTLYSFLSRHPELAAVREEATESLLDEAESHMMRAVRAGDLKTIRWLLMTRGKQRGYTQRIETVGANGGPIMQRVERTYVDPDEAPGEAPEEEAPLVKGHDRPNGHDSA
jgi:hypothetical protein